MLKMTNRSPYNSDFPQSITDLNWLHGSKLSFLVLTTACHFQFQLAMYPVPRMSSPSRPLNGNDDKEEKQSTVSEPKIRLCFPSPDMQSLFRKPNDLALVIYHPYWTCLLISVKTALWGALRLHLNFLGSCLIQMHARFLVLWQITSGR